MRIRKFNEDIDTPNEIIDISNDRISEILIELQTMVEDFDDKKEKISSINTELSNYRSKSRKSNDQIDDSVSNLEMIINNLSDVISLLDSVSSNLKDYDENGRKYLY
jgi:ABC-type transporter Mla subunit MlaD